MTTQQTIEVPISGMDCAECTRHVQHAIEALPGVETATVLLAAEKASAPTAPPPVQPKHEDTTAQISNALLDRVGALEAVCHQED